MRREAIIERLKSLEGRLRAEGVAHIAIFGSRARGDHSHQSDLDLLVDVAPGSRFSLLDLIGVEHIIVDEVGIKANAVMQRSLDAEFRAAIAGDVIRVF